MERSMKKGFKFSCHPELDSGSIHSIEMDRFRVKPGMTWGGFTLAEVLITLGIIGVVAAIVMPSLIANYKKKVVINQLKTNYADITNGFKNIIADNGVDSLKDTEFFKLSMACGSDNTCDKSVYQQYMKKYFNVVETYYYVDQVADGVPTGTFTGAICNQWTGRGVMMYYYLNDNNTCYGVRQQSSKLANGTIMNWAFFDETTDAAWVAIDVNGKKPPNAWGRDVFHFIADNNGNLIPVASAKYAEIMAASGGDYNSNYWNPGGVSVCSKTSTGTGRGCSGRVYDEGWEINYW